MRKKGHILNGISPVSQAGAYLTVSSEQVPSIEPHWLPLISNLGDGRAWQKQVKRTVTYRTVNCQEYHQPWIRQVAHYFENIRNISEPARGPFIDADLL